MGGLLPFQQITKKEWLSVVQIEEIHGGRYVLVETGRIMSLDTALSMWRECWKKERAYYAGLPRYGELSRSNAISEQIEATTKGAKDIDEQQDQQIEVIAYKGSRLDSHTWEYVDDDGNIKGSWLENRQEVARQYFARRYKRSKESISFDVPDGLKPNEKKICDAILNKEHINLKSGLVRYGNGVAMDTIAIGRMAGIYDKRTIQTALKGLIDKGVLKRERVKNTSVYYVNRQKYNAGNIKAAENGEKAGNYSLPSFHHFFKAGAGSWAKFYDHHSTIRNNACNESKNGWWDYLD